MLRHCSKIAFLIFLGSSFSCTKKELSHSSHTADLSENLRITIHPEFDGENYNLSLVLLNSSDTEYLHVVRPDFMSGNFDFTVSCSEIKLHEVDKSDRYVTPGGFEGHVLGPHESFVVKEKIVFGSPGSIEFEKSEQSFTVLDKNYENIGKLQIKVAVSVLVSNFVSGKCDRFTLNSETANVEAPSSWILESKKARLSAPMVAPEKDNSQNFTLPPAPLPSQ